MATTKTLDLKTPQMSDNLSRRKRRRKETIDTNVLSKIDLSFEFSDVNGRKIKL